MDFLLVVATSALAIIAYMQLSRIAENMRVDGEREKKWATLQACDRYNFDSTIHSVTRRIWDKSEGGTSYSDKDAIKHDVISLLNYLDSLAVGIHQGLYVEEIVRDYMEPVIKKAVE